MSAPSEFLDRRLTCGNKPLMLKSLPANWPNRGERLVVDPPVLLDPSKRYRVALDLENGTATITEEAS